MNVHNKFIQKHIHQAVLDSDLCGGPYPDSLARVALIDGAARCLRLLVIGLGMSEEGARREIERTLQQNPLALCDDSPMEKALMAALVFSDWRPFTTIPAFVHNPRAKKAPKGDLVIAPQFPYGPYRLDILIKATNGLGETKLINVEVDGKAYHNTTKVKWDEDRERDENMAAWNVEVKRFWGSVIAKDLFGCAEGVVAILTDWFRNQSR